MADIKIYGTLKNETTDNTIAYAEQIQDTNLDKNQQSINEEVRSLIRTRDNDNYLFAIIDAEENILGGVYKDGTWHFPSDSTLTSAKEIVSSLNSLIYTDTNYAYLWALVDADKNILMAVKTDGTVVINSNLKFADKYTISTTDDDGDTVFQILDSDGNLLIDLISLAKTVAILEPQVTSLKESVTELQSSVTELEDSTASMENRLSEAESDIDELQEETETLQSNLESNVIALEDSIGELEDSINISIEEVKTELQEEIDSVEDTVSELQQTHHDDIEDLFNVIDETEENLQEYTDEKVSALAESTEAVIRIMTVDDTYLFALVDSDNNILVSIDKEGTVLFNRTISFRSGYSIVTSDGDGNPVFLIENSDGEVVFDIDEYSSANYTTIMTTLDSLSDSYTSLESTYVLIQESIDALTSSLGNAEDDISLLESTVSYLESTLADINETLDSLDTMQQSISDLEEWYETLNSSITSLQDYNEVFMEYIDDLITTYAREPVAELQEDVETLQEDVTTLQEYTYVVSNDDYLFAVIDSENNVLGGVQKDGTWVIPKGIPDDTEERLTAIEETLKSIQSTLESLTN